MELLKNIKISFKLFIENYITKKRHNRYDRFMKHFIFRSKYKVDDVIFERCIEGNQLLVVCVSTKYPDITGYFIDSIDTFARAVTDFKLPIYSCVYCGRPVSYNSGEYISNIQIDTSHTAENDECVYLTYDGFFCNKHHSNKKYK